jgi:hypothetical protein
MNHLTDKDLSGYVHQTLTDAERESMNRHLDVCPECRERAEAQKALQRQIHYELSSKLRRERPSSLQFQKIAPQLQKQRRLARIRFHSMQMLTAVVVIAVLVVLATVLTVFFETPAWVTLSSNELPAKSTVLEAAWEDESIYRNGLIKNEREVLDMLATAPIYHLDIEIEPDLQTINGRQELRYVNQTGQPLDELYFRLWPNATFSNLRVTAIRIDGKSVPVEPSPYIKSSDLRVGLAETLPPGKSLTVYMEFNLTVARSRNGFNGTLGLIDDVLTLAHFHPTLAAFQDGTWQLETAVHGMASYPENSFYLVEVTAPENVPIITSGMEIGSEMVGNRQISTFAAGPIGTFYMTASERYTVAMSQTIGETRITSYAYADELTEQAKEALYHTVDALEYMNNHYGAYPYTRLNIIGTPTLNFAQPGVAFPGAVLTNLTTYDYVYDFGQRSLQSAVIYGVVYQWFGHIIGSNRLHAPWLSEAVSEFTTQTIIARVYGEEALDTVEWPSLTERRDAVLIGNPAETYAQEEYLATMYGRGPDFLLIISKAMGDEMWTAVMRDYYQTYKWQSRPPPTTAAFQHLIEEHCTCKLDQFFANWVEKP